MNQYYQKLNIEQRGSLCIVTIDTGNKANALCLDTLQELLQCARSLQDSSEIRCVILRGQPRWFTGGMDLGALLQLKQEGLSLAQVRRAAKLGATVCQAWEDIEPMTIAAIEGACVGGGVALSMALDLRVCAKDSFIYVPEIERGMNMSWQSVPRSVALMGPARSKRLFILAERFDAEQALNAGWSDYICETGAALDKALELAVKLEQTPAMASAMCKQAINVAANALNHAVSYMDADQWIVAQQSDDFERAIESFLKP